MNRINPDQALQNLKAIRTAFPYAFLAYGTALGQRREGAILAHDLDTDVAIRAEDFDWAAVTKAVRNGLDLQRIHGSPDHGLELVFRAGGVKTDLMLLYRTRDGRRWNALWDGTRPIYHVVPEPKLAVGELAGEQFWTPGTEYLRAVYGDEWMTPVTTWNWRTDHHCRVDALP